MYSVPNALNIVCYLILKKKKKKIRKSRCKYAHFLGEKTESEEIKSYAPNLLAPVLVNLPLHWHCSFQGNTKVHWSVTKLQKLLSSSWMAGRGEIGDKSIR